jgi:meiotically up-regulated gene 157 (Mug157) protein
VKQAERCKKWANNLRLALEKNAIIRDKEFGDIWTFEIDGKGKYLLYDQADYPNLLTIPYFGFCKFEDKIYQNTRKFIFSPRNAGYKHTIGRYSALCDGSKQDPQNPWALGIMGELMANPTSQQARKTFDWLENALTSTLTLSETADKYRGRNNWHTFGWATSLMSLLYIEIICGFKPRAKKIIPCVPNGWEKFKSPVIKFHGKPMVLKYESNKTKISLM